MKLAKRAAALVYERGARRVWLFCSLARGRRPDVHSDIDSPVEGLPYRERASIGATREVPRRAGHPSGALRLRFGSELGQNAADAPLPCVQAAGC